MGKKTLRNYQSPHLLRPNHTYNAHKERIYCYRYPTQSCLHAKKHQQKRNYATDSETTQ